MTATTKTRRVAGHSLALTTGRTYLATRPAATSHSGRERFDVTISDISDGFDDREPERVIEGLTYDDANRFLRLFNNGIMSFSGRTW